jgi:hypothetical protein
MTSLLTSLALIGITLSSSIANGQTSPAPDFSKLKVRIGDMVYVTDQDTGVKFAGRLAARSPSEVTVDGHVFQPRPGLKIEREGDPIWEGALAGLGTGLLLRYTAGPDTCRNHTFDLCAIAAGLQGTAVGAYIDWRHKGRTTIYQAARAPGRTSVRLLPQLSARQRGVALTMSF